MNADRESGAGSACASDAATSDTLPPPADAVLLLLSRRVEQDFIARGVFPRLRYAAAKGFQGGSTLHYLSPTEAASVLADAIKRHEPPRGANALAGADRRAFSYHISMLRAAMEEARKRHAEFEATEPFCRHRDDRQEVWSGTKGQLAELGIFLDGPWPREPGGARRWTTARDARGYTAHITATSSIWPGRFEAMIKIPRSAATNPLTNMDDGQRNAQSPHERACAFVVARFDDVTEQLRGYMVGAGAPGESIDDFAAAVARAREALELGLTTDYSHKQKVHRQTLQAKSDERLQAFLARVFRSLSDDDPQ